LKSGDPGFAKTSCAGYTTKCATVYEYPGNPKITLHDLPGFGTTKCSENEYKERMELSKYDCFLIFVGNIEGNDIKIAKILKEMKKPFCFVRSKLDIYFRNARNDGKSEAEVIKEIMSKFLSILTTNGFKEAKCFVISNYKRRIGHFNELVLYIESNLPKVNCNVVHLSMVGEISDDDLPYDPSDDIMDIIYKQLKERVLKISLTSKCLATKPISNMDKKSIISLICKELLSYRKAFGFEQQCVKDIFKDDHIRQKLNASSIVEIQPTDEAMHKFVENKFIESGEDTLRLLNQVLDGCRDDDKLVCLHQRNLSKFFFIIYKNRIIVVIVSVFTSSVVDLGLDPK
jgi:GTP-binding protein EngB required for normal cell division